MFDEVKKATIVDRRDQNGYCKEQTLSEGRFMATIRPHRTHLGNVVKLKSEVPNDNGIYYGIVTMDLEWTVK